MADSKSNRIIGLDGLRVYAIIMIVACHVGALAASSGGIGNKIFFSMSGFLAYYSIKSIKTFKDVLKFYLKRFFRIVPVFWAVLIIVWRLLPGTFGLYDLSSDKSLILNMLFIKNYGHFWFLQHLVLMYLLTPVFYLIYKMVVNNLSKIKLPEMLVSFIAGMVFIVLALLERKFLTPDVLPLSGEGSHAQFQVWMFLFGFATAIIGEALVYSDFYENRSARMNMTVFNLLTDIYAVSFIVIMTISVLPSVYDAGKLMFFGNDIVRTVLSCLMFMLLLISKDSLIAKVINCRVIRHLSALSFGIYLWHFFFLQYFVNESGLHNFFANYFISLCLSLFTYIVVEKNSAKAMKRLGGSIK